MSKDRSNLTSIIKFVSEETDLPQHIVKKIIGEMLYLTMSSVINNENVSLRGFGTFYTKKRQSRRYRDISTGNFTESATCAVPCFRPSKALLRAVAKYPGKSLQKNEDIKLVEEAPVKDLSQFKNGSEPAGCRVIISSPNPNQTDYLKINYHPTAIFDSHDAYPIVYTPRSGSYIKLPRAGRSDIYGYKEMDFMEVLKAEFADCSVSNDFHLKVPGRYIPYEPDIVLYDETLNLYLDIEIDEPYDGYSRLVTHVKEGRDTIRDLFFKESGWIVVRFTERQVHLNSQFCIQTIRNIVDAMRGVNPIHSSKLEKENKWDRQQAAVWEKELYRESYLGIQFFHKQKRTKKIHCPDDNEGIDDAIVRTPIFIKENISQNSHTDHCLQNIAVLEEGESNSSQGVAGIPISESHPSPINFSEVTHSYFTPGDNTGNTNRMSVTTLIDNFFPYFDIEAYMKKRIEETNLSEEDIRRELAEPSERGTDMHKQIECFLKGEPYDGSSVEFQHFLRFYREQVQHRGLVFDSAEYAIELKESNIAGTVDALFRKPNGEYVMIDWKRSKHLIIDGYPKKYGFGRGLSVLSHLDNSSYYKYELQQSFYKYILEKDYGIKISSMVLAVLHPDYDGYYVIRLSEYRKQEVLDMLESYESLQK